MLARRTEDTAKCRNGKALYSLDYLGKTVDPTNQGVVGSIPAGRAKFQGLGSENQVLLPAVGPLWDLLSTGPRDLD